MLFQQKLLNYTVNAGMILGQLKVGFILADTTKIECIQNTMYSVGEKNIRRPRDSREIIPYISFNCATMHCTMDMHTYSTVGTYPVHYAIKLASEHSKKCRFSELEDIQLSTGTFCNTRLGKRK